MKRAEGQEGRSVFVAILRSVIILTASRNGRSAGELIQGLSERLQYFEGVVAAIVPDISRRPVKGPSDVKRPVIKRGVCRFAEHYGCAVYPAGVYAIQKEKALVGSGQAPVPFPVYLISEGMVFNSLDELNTAIHIRC